MKALNKKPIFTATNISLRTFSANTIKQDLLKHIVAIVSTSAGAIHTAENNEIMPDCLHCGALFIYTDPHTHTRVHTIFSIFEDRGCCNETPTDRQLLNQTPFPLLSSQTRARVTFSHICKSACI